MLLGISLSHDASVALLTDQGIVVSAIAEERITRKKNYVGFPVLSLKKLIENYASIPSPTAGVDRINTIVIGSHAMMDLSYATKIAVATLQNPSNPPSTLHDPYPGFQRQYRNGTGKEIIQDLILSQISKAMLSDHVDFVWVRHHDSHLGCALGAIEDKNTLLFSFDGSGDGESAAVAYSTEYSQKYSVLARVPAADSLGNLYSAVTRRYNFKVNQHEGKITGLAAYGDYSGAFEILKSHVEVTEGIPHLRYVKNLKAKLAIRAVRQFGLARKTLISIDEIIQIAASSTTNYPDLAYAVQKVLEETVTEVVEYWVSKSEIKNVSLAGGVFANVKLNQRISELSLIEKVTVFPNMGDGGIAIGGVWSHLSRINKLSGEDKYKDMYLSPEEFEDVEDFEKLTAGLNRSYFRSFTQQAKKIAEEICERKIVAVHWGKMEFGPRALGNRSILLDARHREIVDRTNKRLNRTEFMPFAPIVLSERFSDYFRTTNKTLQPFQYMAMTCDVRPEVRQDIPAVTHIDGTARPQIITDELNPQLHAVMLEYQKLTGCGVMINTSFNMHEEPINYTLADSIRALRLEGVDVLYTKDCRLSIV